MPIFYKAGYKYQLFKDYSIETPITGKMVDLDFVRILPNGVLTTWHGYAWDGPSGPMLDTPDSMRGSLVHDALYQLLRNGLDQCYKDAADMLLHDICVEDGMSSVRAAYMKKAVQWFGGPYTRHESEPEILQAGKR